MTFKQISPQTLADRAASPWEHADDDALLTAIAAGDAMAFDCLMQRHSRTFLALAQRLTGSPSDADEVVQEGFLRVWTHAVNWRTDGGARFTTWFYRVVVNLCMDRRRRASSSPLEDAGELVDQSPSGLDSQAAHEGRTLMAQALAELPERQRAAIALYYYSDVSGPEAAEILEMSLSALEALLVRGRRALRKTLERFGVKNMGDVL